MRDNFDHYFTGWNLISGQNAEQKASFAQLVTAVKTTVETKPEIQEAWRVHQFDDKTSVFKVFFEKFLHSGVPQSGLEDTISLVKSKFKLS